MQDTQRTGIIWRGSRRRRCLALAAVLAAAAFGAMPASAQVAYVNPETGELAASPPPGGQIVAREAGTRGPLEVQTSPVPGGGKMIVLDQRFMPAAVATVGPDGHVTGGCAAGSEAESAVNRAASAEEARR